MTVRTSVLGGEVSGRGLLGKIGPHGGAGLAVVLGVALWTWLGVGGAAGVTAGLAVVLTGFALLYPWAGRRSPVQVWSRRARTAHRDLRGLSSFTGDGLPHPIGRVAPLDLAGTPYEDMFVLAHTNPGERDYLSVVLEVDGQPQGLRTEQEHEESSIRYGVMLSQLAREGSFVRGFQQINRIVPHDAAWHQAFITAKISSRPDLGALVRSYEDLVRIAARSAEQHRNFLVARLPVTAEFTTAARRYGPGPAGWAGLVREELIRCCDLLESADLARPRVLGEQRTCAVLRAMQDPGFPIDLHGDVRWSNCWQPYRGEYGHMTVNDRWHTRTAVLPADAVAPVALTPRWLAPLLMEVDPAVIRTLSVRMEFVPAAAARAQAVRDVAADGAAQLGAWQKGKVGDGTNEVMLSASRLRLDDLTPGSGHHGVNWSMALSVTAADVEELGRACTRVSSAAANCGLSRLEWEDGWHDAAVVATYPLGRGMVTR